MRYKVGVWGQFGDGGKIADGQAVRTTIITNELECKYGKDQVFRANTNNWKKHPFRFLNNTLRLFFKSDNVVVLPADNGFKVIVPIYYFLNSIFKRNLLYIVIGGFLPKLLDNQRRFVKMLKCYKSIYVQTENIKNDLELLGLNNIKFITNLKRINSVSKDELKENEGELVTFVIMSRITEDKGILDSINAVNIANEKLGDKKIRLDIYGMIPDNFKSTFEAAVEENSDVVTYRGVADYNKTVEALKPYFAMLFATYFHGEGFPGCFIDAFNSGLPIIATDWLYNKDLIKDGYNGLLVPIKDPESLSNAILKLYYDRNLTYRLALNSLDKAKDYDPEIVLKDFYSDLV